jgi:hypothetical protein
MQLVDSRSYLALLGVSAFSLLSAEGSAMEDEDVGADDQDLVEEFEEDEAHDAYR